MTAAGSYRSLLQNGLLKLPSVDRTTVRGVRRNTTQENRPKLQGKVAKHWRHFGVPITMSADCPPLSGLTDVQLESRRTLQHVVDRFALPSHTAQALAGAVRHGSAPGDVHQLAASLDLVFSYQSVFGRDALVWWLTYHPEILGEPLFHLRTVLEDLAVYLPLEAFKAVLNQRNAMRTHALCSISPLNLRSRLESRRLQEGVALEEVVEQFADQPASSDGVGPPLEQNTLGVGWHNIALEAQLSDRACDCSLGEGGFCHISRCSLSGTPQETVGGCLQGLLGMSAEAAETFLKANPNLAHADVDQLTYNHRSMVNCLRLPVKKVNVLIASSPEVLLYPPGRLQGMLLTMASLLLMEPEELVDLIVDHPPLLQLTPDALQSRLASLAYHLTLSIDKLVLLARENPWLLTQALNDALTSIDQQAWAKRSHHLAKEVKFGELARLLGVSLRRVRRRVRKQPALGSYTPTHIRQRVEQVAALLTLDHRRALDVLVEHPSLLSSRARLDPTMGEVLGALLGLNQDEVLALLRGSPGLLSLGAQEVYQNYESLCEVLGTTPDDLRRGILDEPLLLLMTPGRVQHRLRQLSDLLQADWSQVTALASTQSPLTLAPASDPQCQLEHLHQLGSLAPQGITHYVLSRAMLLCRDEAYLSEHSRRIGGRARKRSARSRSSSRPDSLPDMVAGPSGRDQVVAVLTGALGISRQQAQSITNSLSDKCLGLTPLAVGQRVEAIMTLLAADKSSIVDQILLAPELLVAPFHPDPVGVLSSFLECSCKEVMEIMRKWPLVMTLTPESLSMASTCWAGALGVPEEEVVTWFTRNSGALLAPPDKVGPLVDQVKSILGIGDPFRGSSSIGPPETPGPLLMAVLPQVPGVFTSAPELVAAHWGERLVEALMVAVKRTAIEVLCEELSLPMGEVRDIIHHPLLSREDPHHYHYPHHRDHDHSLHPDKGLMNWAPKSTAKQVLLLSSSLAQSVQSTLSLLVDYPSLVTRDIPSALHSLGTRLQLDGDDKKLVSICKEIPELLVMDEDQLQQLMSSLDQLLPFPTGSSASLLRRCPHLVLVPVQQMKANVAGIIAALGHIKGNSLGVDQEDPGPRDSYDATRFILERLTRIVLVDPDILLVTPQQSAMAVDCLRPLLGPPEDPVKLRRYMEVLEVSPQLLLNPISHPDRWLLEFRSILARQEGWCYQFDSLSTSLLAKILPRIPENLMRLQYLVSVRELAHCGNAERLLLAVPLVMWLMMSWGDFKEYCQELTPDFNAWLMSSQSLGPPESPPNPRVAASEET